MSVRMLGKAYYVLVTARFEALFYSKDIYETLETENYLDGDVLLDYRDQSTPSLSAAISLGQNRSNEISPRHYPIPISTR